MKLRIRYKNGVVAVRNVKHLKLYRLTHVRKNGAYGKKTQGIGSLRIGRGRTLRNVTHKRRAGKKTLVNQHGKIHQQKTQQRREVEREIENDMMDAFRDFGIGRDQISRKLVDKFDRIGLHDEGNGWYQKNMFATKSGKISKEELKLRYNPSQQRLEVHLRGYRYSS